MLRLRPARTAALLARRCSSLAHRPADAPRDLVIRTKRRSVRDIMKYGMRTSEEERALLDARRTSEIFGELARIEYDTPRLALLLGWYERELPKVGAAEHHDLLRAYSRCKLGERAAAHIDRMRADGCRCMS